MISALSLGGISPWRRFLTGVASLFLALSVLPAQVHQGKTLVTPSLVADATAIVPGKTIEIGILLEIEKGWHTYWLNPGDAGIPFAIEWTLPEGFEAGAIQWPLPQRLIEPGDLEAFAYKDKVLLIVPIKVPAEVSATSVDIRGKASWLVCEEICVPGNADVSLTLPVAKTAESANEGLFAEFRAQLPSAEAPPFSIKWQPEGKAIVLEVAGLPAEASVDFYPLPAQGQAIDHVKNDPVQDGVARMTIPATGELNGLLVVDVQGKRSAWSISSTVTQAASSSAAAVTAAPISLWLALFYGFLGGLILNLMPCVLPVISLKIFGFIRQAGEEPAKIFRHGLVFVAGIFTWFLGLGVIIALIKSAGGEVTWAFQFQNPWFNLAIAAIVFVFALNLFGVFEIILPGKATSALSEASGGEGYAGSYFQGIFATLLATPCTAPFLGSALGYAFSQPIPVIFAMFASVSFGMGLPYLILSARPEWMKLLPKPGAWMERVKQFMGFPLMATLLWLLFILGNQKGLEAVISVLAFLLCLGLACWIYGSFCGPLVKPGRAIISALLALVFAVGGGFFFLGDFAKAARPDSEAGPAVGGIAWEPFSQASLDKLLAEGKPVFLDFTADWCLSCKFNEKTAINTPAVRAILEKHGIIPMKADWTNANPEITALLAKFGRVGVPFYLYYPKGNSTPPVILPEILTEQIVLDALTRPVN